MLLLSAESWCLRHWSVVEPSLEGLGLLDGGSGGGVGVVLVVDAGVLPVGTVVVVAVGEVVVVDEGRRRDVDVGTGRVESALLGGAVLYGAHLAVSVHVTVLAVDLPGRVLGLDLERPVGRLVAVAV